MGADLSLARERTALSWERSALGLGVVAVLAVRVALGGPLPALGLGLAILLIGVATAAVRAGGVRDHDRPHATMVALAAAGGGAAAVAALLALLQE